jgi:hypothetical protein
VSRSLWGGGGAYRAWGDFLERWAAGEPADPAGLPALAPADLPADTWQRLLARISAAVDRRLQGWADALTAALDEAADEFSVGRALAQSRTGPQAVRSLLAHPGLPEDFRTRMAAVIDEHMARLQQDLERSLDRAVTDGLDPRLAEARRRTIRDNPLTAAAPAAWSYDPAAGGRRRVITPSPDK